ncbi:hypothetical protein JYU14_04615 [Simkania negevensis]|uniref:Uncharacterized protein n=1 Tax=Simkania negevensis TaxID=83561 RepID=A0ABS3ATA5_9BACT|nr:hypothetical protein [Simkania negevensis]
MLKNTLHSLHARLFLGFELTHEMQTHLGQSNLWKQHAFLPASEHKLRKVLFQGKNYIGNYFESAAPSLEVIQQHREEFCATLKGYCPDVDVEQVAYHLFSQAFLS